MGQFKDSLRQAHIFAYSGHRRTAELVEFMDSVSSRRFSIGDMKKAWRGGWGIRSRWLLSVFVLIKGGSPHRTPKSLSLNSRVSVRVVTSKEG